MPLTHSRAERPSSLRDYAYRESRDAIVSGELAPGERLRVRRRERARFGSLAGRGSVADHDRIIQLCAAGRADDAGAAARENWSTLGRLLHLDEDDEPTADAQAPA